MGFFAVDREEKRRQDLKDLLDLKDFGRVHVRGWSGWLVKYYRHVAMIGIVVLVILTYYIMVYNQMVALRASVKGSRAQIMSALQMRQNLVPALTVVIRQFVKHEENIFLSTAKSREESMGGAASATALTKKLNAAAGQNALTGPLSHLMAVAENYPQLLSSQSLQQIIIKMAEAENSIFMKRNEYNMAVAAYNGFVTSIPAKFLAIAIGFREEPYFNCDDKPEWIFKQSQESAGFWLDINSQAKRPEVDSARNDFGI